MSKYNIRRELGAARQARLMGFTELDADFRHLAAVQRFHDEAHTITDVRPTSVVYILNEKPAEEHEVRLADFDPEGAT